MTKELFNDGYWLNYDGLNFFRRYVENKISVPVSSKIFGIKW